MFLIVSFVSIGLQIFLVELGGDFVRTSPLNLTQWLITIGLGFLGVPIGILMRFIPVAEDPESFFTANPLIKSTPAEAIDDFKYVNDDYEILLLETLTKKDVMKNERKQEEDDESHSIDLKA